MKTVKKLVTMLLALCLVAGSIGVLPVKASIGVDVTSAVRLDAWGDQAELKFTNLHLGGGVLPTFAYDAMDKEAYMYVQEYIAINGETVKDINTNTDTSGYEFTVFPSTIGAPYNVPVILLQDGENITIKIHGTYLATLADISITVKAGLSFVNGDSTYTVSEDVTFNLVDGNWVKQMSEADITDLAVLKDWGSQAEFQFTNLTFGSGVLTAFSYGAIDGDYTYLQNYLTVNGRTVADINANTDTSEYEFTVFPSTVGAPYNVPVMLLQDGDNLTIKIHSAYLAGVENVTIGVKTGFSIENGAKKYCVNDDLNYVLTDGAWVLQKKVVDIAADVRLTEWNAQENLQYAQLFLGAGVLPEFGYGAIDGAYTYLQEYIKINGRTIADINANTDTSNYEFVVFPSTIGAPYNVPVLLYQDGENLTIKVHNSYLPADAKVEIEILENAYITEGRISYVVGENLLFHWNGELWAPGKGHDLIHFDAVAPGCHYIGNVEYWFCKDCEGFWTDEACTQLTNSKSVILPEAGSENVVHVPAKAATCKTEGNIEYWHCKDCEQFWQNKELTQLTNSKNVILGKADHKEVKLPAVPAQVGKEGLTEGSKCSVCGDPIKEQKKVPALKLAKPKATKVTKATGGKKQITVKFKKVSGVTSYEIQIATKKNMKKGLKTIKVTKAKDMKNAKFVVKKLKAKTTYYVRIRTVKTVNGVTASSSWSKVVKATKTK